MVNCSRSISAGYSSIASTMSSRRLGPRRFALKQVHSHPQDAACPPPPPEGVMHCHDFDEHWPLNTEITENCRIALLKEGLEAFQSFVILS